MRLKTACALSSGVLILILVLTGCSTIKETATDIKKSMSSLFGGSDDALSAAELAASGMEAFDDGEYKKAADRFQRLKDIYPFSKYAMLAELKLGDAHYQLGQYEDAVFAYEEFEKLHPRNEAVPYVIYQIGRCHLDQVSTPDRDQTAARKALDTFLRLQRQFPDNPYTRSAAEYIVACYKSLAGHEYAVGAFYYNTKHYKAALGRFRIVVTEYPDVGYHQPSLGYIASCEKKLAEEKTAEKDAADAPPAETGLMSPDNG